MAMKVIFASVALKSMQGKDVGRPSGTGTTGSTAAPSTRQSGAPSGYQNRDIWRVYILLGLLGCVGNLAGAVAGIILLCLFPCTVTLAVLVAWLILVGVFFGVFSVSVGRNYRQTTSGTPYYPPENSLRLCSFVSVTTLLISTACFVHGLIILLQKARYSHSTDAEVLEILEDFGLQEMADKVGKQMGENRIYIGAPSTAVGLATFFVNVIIAAFLVRKSSRSRPPPVSAPMEIPLVTIAGSVPPRAFPPIRPNVPSNIEAPPDYTAATVTRSSSATSLNAAAGPPPTYSRAYIVPRRSSGGSTTSLPAAGSRTPQVAPRRVPQSSQPAGTRSGSQPTPQPARGRTGSQSSLPKKKRSSLTSEGPYFYAIADK